MSKKILIMLVAIVIGAFSAPVAMALNFAGTAHQFLGGDGNTAGTILNPEGKGDVLICPYYDVRPINGTPQENYFAIINEGMSLDTVGGVAAKLRFREWDKSEEVFDIDIWLSKNDVWVGVLVRDASGLTQLTSPDWVIVGTDDDPFSFILSKTSVVSTGVLFSTANVPGGATNIKTPPAGFDVAWTPADFTNLGYFEIIGEERTVNTATIPTSGSPYVLRLFDDYDCPNTLSAYVFVVRVTDGTSMAYDCTAIANFRTDLLELFEAPGGTLPSLFQCQDGLDQLEFQLSKSAVYQGYSIEAGVNAAFDLIVTFPTKHFHFGPKPIYTVNGATTVSLVPKPPFVGGTGQPNGFHANDGEAVSVTIWDRNENTALPGFVSPQTPLSFNLPYEVNIAGLFRTAPATLPRALRANLGWSTGSFESGWLWVDLAKRSAVSAPLHNYFADEALGYFGNTFDGYNGLPAIAMVVQEFQNLTLTPAGFYGDFLPAFYEVDWIEED
jgi:hypothetical protein